MLRRLVLLFLLAILVPLSAAAGEAQWRSFAGRLGIADVDGLVETLAHLDRTGRLPPRYATKAEARRLGWEPGRDLWAVAPGRVIGGDVFGNRERRLPPQARDAYREADLDYRGGRRNARRLVFDRDGGRWVTIDHYESFHRVPQ
ncbi:guanyl-specific ribonuclease Sa [Stella humosa]|uniref:Ribonuclease n=1 Tax=Stella humosa TaxID=94 RepID=A0A3N1LK64_9PROT|nr:ribonuclease domain-containing protein [Stella humosa]ROP91384.1 guanyl-specific ribonuclease Sa [Stella humosa]BBK34256.1 hypothetical protein STHU_48900 [Stella humosa]